jgi:hypothetical protein
VLDKISTRKMREWLDQPTEDPPQERLAYFNTLLERCRASDHMKGQPLNLSPSQLKDIGRLHNEFRNGFTHFLCASGLEYSKGRTTPYRLRGCRRH